MKVIALTGVACAVVGFTFGWLGASDKFELQQLRADEVRTLAEKERNHAIGQVSTEYYNLYQEFINREPIIRTERVFVKADCPMRADTGSGVDDAPGAGRVELASTVVRSLDRVIDEAERRYGMCAAQLAALQEVVRVK